MYGVIGELAGRPSSGSGAKVARSHPWSDLPACVHLYAELSGADPTCSASACQTPLSFSDPQSPESGTGPNPLVGRGAVSPVEGVQAVPTWSQVASNRSMGGEKQLFLIGLHVHPGLPPRTAERESIEKELARPAPGVANGMVGPAHIPDRLAIPRPALDCIIEPQEADLFDALERPRDHDGDVAAAAVPDEADTRLGAKPQLTSDIRFHLLFDADDVTAAEIRTGEVTLAASLGIETCEEPVDMTVPGVRTRLVDSCPPGI